MNRRRTSQGGVKLSFRGGRRAWSAQSSEHLQRHRPLLRGEQAQTKPAWPSLRTTPAFPGFESLLGTLAKISCCCLLHIDRLFEMFLLVVVLRLFLVREGMRSLEVSLVAVHRLFEVRCLSLSTGLVTTFSWKFSFVAVGRLFEAQVLVAVHRLPVDLGRKAMLIDGFDRYRRASRCPLADKTAGASVPLRIAAYRQSTWRSWVYAIGGR